MGHNKAHRTNIFIIYAHDGPDLNEAVLKLKHQLQWHNSVWLHRLDATSHGSAHVNTDHDYQHSLTWHRWMQHTFSLADRVLVVCTPRLKKIFDYPDANAWPPSGVAYEAEMVRAYLHACRPRNGKIIPIMLDDGDVSACVPDDLLPYWMELRFPSATAEIRHRVLSRDSYAGRARLQLRRIWNWCSDYPGRAALTGFGTALLVGVAGMLLRESSLFERKALEEAAQYNATLAAADARIVLNTIQDSAAKLKRCARDLERTLQDAVSRTDFRWPAFKPCVDELHFDVMFFESAEGYMRVRWPAPIDASIRNTSFRSRNYFTCAFELQRRLAREVCISKTYAGDPRGEGHRMQYSLSTPAYDSSGKWIGVLVAQRSIASAVDVIQASSAYGTGQIISVLGPTDTLPHRLKRNTPAAECRMLQPDSTAPIDDRHGPRSMEPDLSVVIHGLARSDRLCRIDSRLSDDLQNTFQRSENADRHFSASTAAPRTSTDYIDPISGLEGVAGFAPVGNTGYIVVVFTPRSTALKISNALKNTLLIGCLGLVLASALVTGVRVYASVVDR